MDAEHINNIEFARRTKVSRTTLDEIVKRGNARSDVYEKFILMHMKIITVLTPSKRN